VAIARALITSPKLILADEPTGNLDSTNGEQVMQMLEQMNAEGTTIVMVTHSMNHAERAHRLVNLFDGQMVMERIDRVFEPSR
jgi:putative ABC transport system ATP-binding protein